MLGWSFTVRNEEGEVIDFYEETIFESFTLDLLKSGQESGASVLIEDHGGYPDIWYVSGLGWTYEVWDQS